MSVAAAPKARYRQIALALEADILSGHLKAGDQIPSERTMADEMGISRMTARKALQELTGRGMLKTLIGHGTFVSTPAIQQELTALSGFTQDMERLGRTTTSILVNAEHGTPSAEAAKALELLRHHSVYKLARVRLADGMPVAFECAEIDAKRTPDLFSKADFTTASLYMSLEKYFGIIPTSAEQTVAADLADPATALRLKLDPGAAVLRQTRLTRDAGGRPF
ncbi:MAG: GntR family transcriptional regulator, partial [Rhodobacteraceae bacterium]|nr:GntR family transcriptional regulator [Paracoccaceae bacterium]